MSDDRYEPGAERTLTEYRCGLRAGDRLRLRSALPVVMHTGQPTGEVYEVGPLWTVVPGVPHEANVVWLSQPNGELHTWDETVLETFELVARAPEAGTFATLIALPEGFEQFPEDARLAFRRCLGVKCPVLEVDDRGLVVLEVYSHGDETTWENEDIRVEAELVTVE